MPPIHDVDAILLLAIALSSKRRPAELAEIMAAINVINELIPYEHKLADAFYRLSANGLIVVEGEGYTLTEPGLGLMEGHPKKADSTGRVACIRENLSTYQASGEHPLIELSPEQIGAAIKAHRIVARGPGRNMAMPKPKVEWDYSRPGPRRKPKGSVGSAGSRKSKP